MNRVFERWFATKTADLVILDGHYPRLNFLLGVEPLRTTAARLIPRLAHSPYYDLLRFSIVESLPAVIEM